MTDPTLFDEPKSRMHFARIESSPRLQQLLALLQDRGSIGVTGWEIAERIGVLNPATEISQVRHNGYKIECTLERMTENRRRVYRYRLIEKQSSPFLE